MSTDDSAQSAPASPAAEHHLVPPPPPPIYQPAPPPVAPAAPAPLLPDVSVLTLRITPTQPAPSPTAPAVPATPNARSTPTTSTSTLAAPPPVLEVPTLPSTRQTAAAAPITAAQPAVRTSRRKSQATPRDEAAPQSARRPSTTLWGLAALVLLVGAAGWAWSTRSSDDVAGGSTEQTDSANTEEQPPPPPIQQPGPPVIAPEALPAGFDIDQLLNASKDWLVWATAQPIETHPIHDTTGEHCAAGQAPDGVWNLAGSFGTVVTRQCTVPSGRPLLVPGINQWCEPAIDCSLAGDGEHSVTVNGIDVGTVRLAASNIQIDAAPNNGMFAIPGPQQAAMYGSWAVVDPLPVGDHVVRIVASRPGFSIDVTYNLTVV